MLLSSTEMKPRVRLTFSSLSVNMLPTSSPLNHQVPRSHTHTLHLPFTILTLWAIADYQRSTTNTGPRTTTKFEMVPSSQVSKPDGTMLSQFSNPTTRSLTIWTTGLNRGLARRKYPRGLGNGNMDSRRVLRVVRRLGESRCLIQ